MRLSTIFVLTSVLLAVAGLPALADWPHDVKWDQLLPRDTVAGASYVSTGEGIEAITADDFPCMETGWITDIEFTGWPTNVGLQSFRVAFWSDCPATAEDESHPAVLLYEETFGPADPQDPLSLGWKEIAEETYKINIPQERWFLQEGSPTHLVVYWISIQGIMDPASSGGFYWCFRERNEQTWGDDAAFASDHFGYKPWANWGWPTMTGPQAYEGKLPEGWVKSADMSFRLTGIVPEPASVGLVCLIGLAFIRRRLR